MSSELFQKNIQDWVSIDNEIKKLQTEIKELRSNRSDLTNNIFTYVETNNLENAVVQITDGKLKFQNVKQTSPLTFKLLEACLNDCVNDEEKVKQIIKYVKSKREFKYNYDIRRSYS